MSTEIIIQNLQLPKQQKSFRGKSALTSDYNKPSVNDLAFNNDMNAKSTQRAVFRW